MLYSFAGGYQPADYMSRIRPNILRMKHPQETLIENTGMWHFDKIVFNKDSQNMAEEIKESISHKKSTESYNKLLLNSQYSLCPSGSGPNSIRFWEALGAGSIPILLSNYLELPKHELWDKAILRLMEADVYKIPEILSKISTVREKEMRRNCLKIYEHFKLNYKNE